MITDPIEGRLIGNEIPDAIIAIDGGCRIVWWNAGAERIYGYTAQEAVGAGLGALIVPQDQDDGMPSRVLQAAPGEVLTWEALRRRKDGLLIHADVTARRLEQAGPRSPLGVLCEKDVTQLKIRRDAKLLETRFRELFELMPDGIVMLNATGRIVLANRQAETLFGYPPGSLLGEPVERLLPERLRHAHLRHRAGYVIQPRVRTMGAGLDLYGLRADGQEFPVEISLSPLQTAEGTLVLSAIRDATDRRRFETAMREKNEQLAAAMQAKDRFLATMSHELRTPLNAIIGFTGTLLMKLPGPLNADQEKQLRTVQRSSHHLLSLINDLLDLARIEAGKLDLHRERLVCQDVLQDVAGTLMPQAALKGLAFDLAMPPVAVPITTDRRALTQIVTNLIANAVKYCDSGHVLVTLDETTREGRPVVRIAVADTGVGIRPEDLATVFDAFARFQTESGPREGSGLGLHLSRRLAEVLDGHLSLHSEYGQGSTFTLLLPGD